MKSYNTMLKTEIKLSIRDMNMVIFAVIMPAVITFILGMIYGNAPAFEGAGYSFMDQSFGALSTIAICAGGVMGLPIAVSEYRHRKILKRFKVTPVSPAKLLGAQVSMYILYSLVSLVLVYLISTLFFGFRFQGSIIKFIVSYTMVMVSMFSIGVMVGGIAPDSKTAGIIASLLYFPMLIFSGTTLPYEVMPAALQNIADVLPLTQGIKLIKAAVLNQPVTGVYLPVVVMLVIAFLCVGISLKFFRWE